LVATIYLATLTINEEGEDASSLNPRARILKPILPDTNLVQKSDFKYWNNVPEGLRLCHVSQYWRTVVPSLPPLWSHIRVNQNTNPEMLKFVRDNAKQCSIDLDIRNHALSPDFKAYDVVMDVLKNNEQLSSLALSLYGFALIPFQPAIFLNLTESAHQL
jgi:hypothetical protein